MSGDEDETAAYEEVTAGKEAKEEEPSSDQAPEEEGFSEDEEALFQKLMKKVVDTGAMDKELSKDLSNLSERVDNVVDSIERIERIEKTQLERKLFDDFDEASGPEREKTSFPIQEREAPEIMVPEEIAPVEEVEAQGQIFVPSETPYIEVKEGRAAPSIEFDRSRTYGRDLEQIIENLLRLINLKLENGRMDEAKSLANIARSVGRSSPYLLRNFSEVFEKLGLSPIKGSQDGTAGTEATSMEHKASTRTQKETKVLDPELADEIGKLQESASSAISRLDSLLESSSMSQEDFVRVKNDYFEASKLFGEKMFHKALTVALGALDTIKNQAQRSIDAKVQDDLYRTKEMLDSIMAADTIDDPAKIDQLKETLDRAMKAYLTNEYEKANLLCKRVMNALLDIKGPEAVKFKERIAQARKDVSRLKEQSALSAEVAEVDETLSSLEALMHRRDYANVERIMVKIEGAIAELKSKGEIFTNAKELEIRLTNRVKRAKDMGYDLADISKKLDFLHNFFKSGRYDDVLVIGGEMETSLNNMEQIKKEMEAREVLDELEVLVQRLDVIEGAEQMKASFSLLKEKYIKGDTGPIRTEGKDLLDMLKKKQRTVGAEKAKRVAKGVIESKLLLQRLRSLNLDTMDLERRVRKAKNVIKEEGTAEGIRELEAVVSEMDQKLSTHLEYMKKYLTLYKESLEVIMDRHREEPIVYYLKERHVPLLYKLEVLGRLGKAIEGYRSMEEKFREVVLSEDRKALIENLLNECRFEIYRRKEIGMDISEPMALYTLAHKRFSEGKTIPAEYLIEISRRYCNAFLPVEA